MQTQNHIQVKPIQLFSLYNENRNKKRGKPASGSGAQLFLQNRRGGCTTGSRAHGGGDEGKAQSLVMQWVRGLQLWFCDDVVWFQGQVKEKTTEEMFHYNYDACHCVFTIFSFFFFEFSQKIPKSWEFVVSKF